MRDDEYYRAIAKAAENWRRQNAFALQEIAVWPITVQPAYISMLRDLEKSMVGFRSMQEQICTLSASISRIEPALGQSIREANLQMSAVLVSLKPYQDFAIRLQEDHRRWAESVKASIGALSQVTGIAAIIGQDFSIMSNSALFAQQSAARINFQAIGEAAKIAAHARAALYQPLREMADSYRSLMGCISHRFTKAFLSSIDGNQSTEYRNVPRNSPSRSINDRSRSYIRGGRISC